MFGFLKKKKEKKPDLYFQIQLNAEGKTLIELRFSTDQKDGNTYYVDPTREIILLETLYNGVDLVANILPSEQKKPERKVISVTSEEDTEPQNVKIKITNLRKNESVSQIIQPQVLIQCILKNNVCIVRHVEPLLELRF